MNIVNEPLFYVALGVVGMFLCAWLFDRAYGRYMPDADEEPEPVKPSSFRSLIYMVAAAGLAIILWFAFYRTSLLVADALLLAALTSFVVGSYRIRLRPLLDRGITIPHLAPLIFALALWGLPMLWFMHLYAVEAYRAT
jgi:hypothetical protein